MTSITQKLAGAILDKDNMPRMDSEKQVAVGLAKEAMAEIDRLRRAIEWSADTAYNAFKDGDDEAEALSAINNNCRAVLREQP